jgi:hypothetical protein
MCNDESSLAVVAHVMITAAALMFTVICHQNKTGQLDKYRKKQGYLAKIN